MYSADTPQYELTKQYRDTISTEHILSYYPFFQDGQDRGSIHPLMLSYYVLLGNELGQIATVEATIFDEDQRIAIQGDTRGNTAQAADSGWFHPDDYSLQCAVEFQFGKKKVPQKAKHLVQYADAYSSIDLLVLHVWSTDRGVPGEDVLSILRSGYTNDDGVEFGRPSADVVVMKSRFETVDGLYQLQRTHEVELFPDPHA